LALGRSIAPTDRGFFLQELTLSDLSRPWRSKSNGARPWRSGEASADGLGPFYGDPRSGDGIPGGGARGGSLLPQQHGAGPAFTKEIRIERVAHGLSCDFGGRCCHRSHRTITAAMGVAASMPMPHTRQIRSLRCALSALARCHVSQ
jgi:hypothetical protein